MANLMISLLVAFTASSFSLSARAEALPCDQIVQMIMPCVPYLTDRAAMPFGPCCNEVVALNQTASTRRDRIAICCCIEHVAPRFPRVDFMRAAALPQLCGVVLHNFTISPHIDCDRLP